MAHDIALKSPGSAFNISFATVVAPTVLVLTMVAGTVGVLFVGRAEPAVATIVMSAPELPLKVEVPSCTMVVLNDSTVVTVGATIVSAAIAKLKMTINSVAIQAGAVDLHPGYLVTYTDLAGANYLAYISAVIDANHIRFFLYDTGATSIPIDTAGIGTPRSGWQGASTNCFSLIVTWNGTLYPDSSAYLAQMAPYPNGVTSGFYN